MVRDAAISQAEQVRATITHVFVTDPPPPGVVEIRSAGLSTPPVGHGRTQAVSGSSSWLDHLRPICCRRDDPGLTTVSAVWTVLR
jgi:hypothetical protein